LCFMTSGKPVVPGKSMGYTNVTKNI